MPSSTGPIQFARVVISVSTNSVVTAASTTADRLASGSRRFVTLASSVV